jgi:hypothetical protein
MSVTARFCASLSWLYSAMKGYAEAHVAMVSIAAQIEDRMVEWQIDSKFSKLK